MGARDYEWGVSSQAARLAELLQTERKIITSTDLDGLLTAALLASVSGWKLAGFFDSRDSLWNSEKNPLDSAVHAFVDVHVALEDWISIDQHIIAADSQHAARLSQSGNKINPNLARNTVFMDAAGRGFTSKYPFGTFHFVLALLEARDIPIRLNLSHRIAHHLTLLDLVLRADGTAENTRTYARNTADWWAWLRGIGKRHTHTIAAAAQAAATSPAKLMSLKRDLHEFFVEMGCSTSDANFSAMLRGDMSRVGALVGVFHEWFGIAQPPDFGSLVCLSGRHVRVSPQSTDRDNILRREDLFTYAFTSTRSGGFSATLLDIAAEGRPRRS